MSTNLYRRAGMLRRPGVLDTDSKRALSFIEVMIVFMLIAVVGGIIGFVMMVRSNVEER